MPTPDLVPTTYLEHRLPLPPEEATSAFDAAIERTVAQRWPGPPAIKGPTTVLRLRPTGPVEDRGPHFPVRTLFAELVAGRRRQRVELELLRWSDTASALGLRRSSGRIPSPTDLRWVAYQRAGLEALDHLASLVLDEAAEANRREGRPAA